MPLNFDDLRIANLARCNTTFHPRGGIGEWSVSDWAVAVGGEAGEALNVAKKLRRLETAPNACRQDERDPTELARKLVAELADVVIYADLLAARVGLDLGRAIIEKFNAVSERVGSTVAFDPAGVPNVEFAPE